MPFARAWNPPSSSRLAFSDFSAVVLYVQEQNRLRHDNHLAAFEHDVLIQIAPFFDVGVIKHDHCFLAILLAQNPYVVIIGKGREPSGQGQCLNDVNVAAHHELARLVDFADDEDLVTGDLLHRYAYVRVRNILAQTSRDLVLELLRSLPLRANIAHQWKGEPAIRSDQHFTLQILLFPDEDLQQVFRPDFVFTTRDLAGTDWILGRRCIDQDCSDHQQNCAKPSTAYVPDVGGGH